MSEGGPAESEAGAVCDVCGRDVPAGTRRLPTEDFREAVREGFLPPGSSAGGERTAADAPSAQWRERALADLWDWRLCAECAARAEGLRARASRRPSAPPAAAPIQRPAAASPEPGAPLLAEVIGVSGGALDWSRARRLVVALIVSDFVYYLEDFPRGFSSLPPSFWVSFVVTNVLQASCLILAFRLTLRVWPAAAIAALTYTLARLGIGLALGQMAAGGRFFWRSLAFGGLWMLGFVLIAHFVSRRLGIGAGLAIGGAVASLAVSILLQPLGADAGPYGAALLASLRGLSASAVVMPVVSGGVLAGLLAWGWPRRTA